uniref:Uncharacterized protein n=1 Tax=Romanomermis culicivorax TaxID=13658 RepID=A0A915I3M1_ROMCU
MLTTCFVILVSINKLVLFDDSYKLDVENYTKRAGEGKVSLRKIYTTFLRKNTFRKISDLNSKSDHLKAALSSNTMTSTSFEKSQCSHDLYKFSTPGSALTRYIPRIKNGKLTSNLDRGRFAFGPIVLLTGPVAERRRRRRWTLALTGGTIGVTFAPQRRRVIADDERVHGTFEHQRSTTFDGCGHGNGRKYI